MTYGNAVNLPFWFDVRIFLTWFFMHKSNNVGEILSYANTMLIEVIYC